MYSYGPPLMAEQKQDDQLEHTYSSFVRIRDVALNTCLRWRTIGRSDERGSGISVLAARDDDNFPKDVSLKLSLKPWMEFELVNNDIAVQRVIHSTTETPSRYYWLIICYLLSILLSCRVSTLTLLSFWFNIVSFDLIPLGKVWPLLPPPAILLKGWVWH